MKKFIMTALIATLLFGSLASTGFAADTTKDSGFSDINKSYAKDAILELQSKGILNGVDGSHFNPKGNLTRAEYVTMIVKSLGLDTSDTTSSFSDVAGWAIPYVEAAYKAGLISGIGGGRFSPNAITTKEMAIVILVRALQTKGTLDDKDAKITFTDANSISDWAKPFIAIAQKYGLVTGNPDGSFSPKSDSNREMAAVIGSHLLVAIEKVIKENIANQTPNPTQVPATPTIAPTATATPTVTPTPTPIPTTAPSSGGNNNSGGGTPTSSPTVTPTATLSSIAIITPATKLTYLVGEPLDITGLVVTGTYSDNTTKAETITLGDVTGFDSSVVVASKTLTITVNGQTVTYNVVINPETLLSNPSLTVYEPNLNKSWIYGGKTYAPNTVFQVNVNFNSGTLSSAFESATVSIYNGNTLLSTDTANITMLNHGYQGLTDVFAMGDTANADNYWSYGGYASSQTPTIVEFRLVDNQNNLHVVQASMVLPTAPIVENPETLLSKPTLEVYAPNLNKEWVYDATTTYAPNTVYQVNVNFASGTLSSKFLSAEVSLYNENTLLSTNTAKGALLSGGNLGLSDIFAMGDAANTKDDPNWNIGGYASNLTPTRVVFTLIDDNGVLHVVEAPIS